MKWLKTYKIFENYNRFGSGTITESKSYLSAEMFDEDYSIIDWFEDLKSDNRRPSNIQRHKIWTEHFVGEGWWDKITSHVDKIFEVL